MEVSFRRIDNDRHEFSVRRADESTDALVVETKSLLPHDLAHLATESALGTDAGFYGRVAAGASLHGTWPDDPTMDELMAMEGLAARVQSLWAAHTPPASWAAILGSATLPLDHAVVAGIHERLRRLHGHWRATPFAEAMTVAWPYSPPD